MKVPATAAQTSLPSGYRFADLTLDLGQRRLARGGEAIALGKLSYALLVALVESAPNVLTHDDIANRVWGGRATSAETITRRIKLLRDALEDDAERPRYVGLVRGQGYKLLPPVEPLRGSSSTPAGERVTAGAAPVGRRRAALAAFAAVLLLFVATTAYFAPPRFAGSSAETPAGSSGALDYEITQLTTTGRAVMPAISPDGKYVVYAQLDDQGLSNSLWLRQIESSGSVQVLAPEPPYIFSAPTVSHDMAFIDYIKSGPNGRELWRIPFLGGAPRKLRGAIVSSPIGWSPDGRRGAFMRNDAHDNTTLVVFHEGGEERVIATRTVPSYLVAMNIVGGPQIRPSWSPDGRLIALFEFADILAPRITFIDAATGAETTRDSQGSFTPQGVGWLGPSTLVVNQPGGFGQRIQLWRMAYPSGTVAPLTNDLATYMGVDLDRSRTRLVTERHDVRASVWVGDTAGSNAVEVVPPTPFSGANVLLSWAGERLLYDATLEGRPVIAAVAPGNATPEVVVPDAFHVAASEDGGTIVFGDATRGREGLWKVDGQGRPPVQLVRGFAVEPVVTRQGEVVFSSNASGRQSPWIVPLDGGDATEIAQQVAYVGDVSPDGRWLALLAPRSQQSVPGQRVLVVCELPRCTNRREMPVPPNFRRPLHWTPDGQELAYVSAQGTEIWAVPLDGAPPHALTNFGPDTSQIAQFGWSRDGSRLAFIRLEVEHNVVLLTGLRP